MGKTPKVSACVPVFNGERYIKETVESLLAQDHPDYEVLVVDNASTDKTAEILSGFQDKRLRVERFEENVHSCTNWTRCLRLAKGEVVAVCHSDDLYESFFLSEGTGFLERNKDCSAVFSAATLISGTGSVIGETRRPGAFSIGKTGAVELIHFCAKEGYFPLICPSFIGRKSAIEKTGGFDCAFKYAFDMDYYMRLLALGKIGFNEKKTMRYRQHPFQGSVTLSGSGTDTQSEFFAILERERAKWGVELCEEERKRLAAYRRWGRIVDALNNIRHKNNRTALQITKESFSPSDAFVDFPSPRFLFRSAFTTAFLASQYAGLGGAFASAVFWYRARKRRG